MNQKLTGFSKCKIVVVGDVMLDVYFMGEVKRLSPEAPVPVVKINAKTHTLGGAGNVSLNLAGLGCRTSLYGVRGDDPAGEQISEILREKGIADHLVVDTKQPTTSKTRIVGQGQQLLRLDEEETWNGSGDLCSRLLDRIIRDLEDADAVILSDYSKGVLSRELTQPVIRKCRKRDIPVLIDPKRVEWERYKGGDCVTPNLSELEDVIGKTIDGDESMLVEVAQSLRKKYQLSWLVITRGPDGMCLVGDDNEATFIKATAREVYDVSGAGDTVIAAITAGIASGFPKNVAVEIANTAAGIVVGKLGSQPIQLPELETALRISEIGSLDADMKKISSFDTAQIQVKGWQAVGDKVIFLQGCFDLFHPGHKHVLRRAKELGGRLVVGLNTDDLVKKIKGTARPILTEKDRADMLTALDSVDLVVSMRDESPMDLIKKLRPDIYINGNNSRLKDIPVCQTVEAYGGEVCQIPMLSGYSTTAILETYFNRVGENRSGKDNKRKHVAE